MRQVILAGLAALAGLLFFFMAIGVLREKVVLLGKTRTL